MLLTDYFFPEHSIGWDYAKACGVKNVVLHLPEEGFDISKIGDWLRVIEPITEYGMKVAVIEPIPNHILEHIKRGDEQRDACINKVIDMIRIMDRLDIRTICFNFMAYVGWFRTGDHRVARDVAYVTEFDITDTRKRTFEGQISEQQLWDNYTVFVRKVVPYAEKYHIQLALHPDDPPIRQIGNVNRIMTSYKNIDRALHVAESDNLGITMCQANFYLMGEDLFEIIPKLKDKIKFIHFRNVVGNKNAFHETFHDDGALPMARLIRLYKSLNIDVPIRIDHVPTMMDEAGVKISGYGNIGKLFALGYLKGLLEN